MVTEVHSQFWPQVIPWKDMPICTAQLARHARSGVFAMPISTSDTASHELSTRLTARRVVRVLIPICMSFISTAATTQFTKKETTPGTAR